MAFMYVHILIYVLKLILDNWSISVLSYHINHLFTENDVQYDNI
jgi:hypothetical protein